jgi:methyl-accepting chemotaxis protein
MTSKADDIWVKKQSKIQKYIIWRYIGTYNGIVRFVPLAKLDKAYNPTLRPWYRRALSQPGKSVFSTPYQDAFGACYIVTLSHTLYLGK